jgi:16S rRNA (adenine1518-N6/adenine1519-N6)-dimethyltransferase
VSIRPIKRLGQNFLRDTQTASDIVRLLPPATNDLHILEIGPGTGALTTHLVQQGYRVTAVEIDERAVSEIAGRFPSVHVVQGDILTEPIDRLLLAGRKTWVIGNLPYYITSPILFRLLEARDQLEGAVVMMQKEVADRILSTHGSKVYGILSVLTQLWGRPEVGFDVPPTAFYPVPSVDSHVFRVFFDRPPLPIEDKSLAHVVRTAFNQRRKTLRNSLKSITQGRELPEQWDSLRPEQLSPSQFLTLARYLQPD